MAKRNGFCIPVLKEQGEICLELKEGYHPLMKEPVKNSVTSKEGVLLTGSNASGKSTFLKMVALNAILAQTVHTCTAEAYRAPYFRLYSSMSLRDDLEGGDSYYVVEIKALKRILTAAKEPGRPVLCFVDEVLRGTNTVERIAASTQILKSLHGDGVLCFAATHDIELTQLLEKFYDNYHFEEEIVDGDILFQYRLLPGKATTRNAIKLLEIMGYDPEVIQNAQGMAEDFLRTGQWKEA
ncbi:MAG: DNA mismatch repair protein MutS [Lachnospiraceae bacterium]|nr:DNA mismatch repair protein MutS [Lachnospiraceae bacterium]